MRVYRSHPTFTAEKAGGDRLKLRVEVRLQFGSAEEVGEYLRRVGDRSAGRPLLLVRSDPTNQTRDLRIAPG
jgi:hypothetical protein